MDASTEQPRGTPPFMLLNKISTQAATNISDHLAYVKQNILRRLPWFYSQPEYQKVKGRSKKVALIGGGPSLKNYIDDIKQFDVVISCGSVNDFLMENGIVPTYSVICDPDPISINYFKHTDTQVKYLLATCCSPKIFDHFDKDKQVILWNCHSDECAKKLKEEYEETKSEELAAILALYVNSTGGGCTVGLRALSLAISMGYNNIHMFGFDSCIAVGDKHHAYDFSDKSEELGVIYEIKLAPLDRDPGDLDRTFYCAGYQLAQAEHFKVFYGMYHQIFTPVVYGDGLIAYGLDLIHQKAAELSKQQQSTGVYQT